MRLMRRQRAAPTGYVGAAPVRVGLLPMAGEGHEEGGKENQPTAILSCRTYSLRCLV